MSYSRACNHCRSMLTCNESGKCDECYKNQSKVKELNVKGFLRMSKLTPEQAWQHVRALYKDADGIEQGTSNQETVVRMGQYQRPLTLYRMNEIDWPDGVDRWPPPEPQYREPTQSDVGKMVEVRDDSEEEWGTCLLLAILPDRYHYRFIVDTSHKFDDDFFEYYHEARIAVDDAQTEDKSSANDAQPCPIDEANTARLAQLKEPTHEDAEPIKTAPKDRLVWLWMGGKWMVGSWEINAWFATLQPNGWRTHLRWIKDNQPTHWRPIE